ncbi:hypothetical protein [Acidianus sp. RZ1]|nr:hypothetical protein [Acidianus sp. RZ1]NON62816.1 hypothetical protein [Acidianus sp. RZ1]
MDEKELVLKSLDKVDRWYIMLAGIKENNLLLVTKREVPSTVEVDGIFLNVIHYDPDQYLEEVSRNEELFRSYKVYYFVKTYMRKLLDLLSSLEVQRMSLTLEDFEEKNR